MKKLLFVLLFFPSITYSQQPQIPNVFSPNNDGINDFFTIISDSLQSVEGMIFNRWGEKIYEWNSVKGGWDGRTNAGIPVSEGVYFYIINTKVGNSSETLRGAITLIR